MAFTQSLGYMPESNGPLCIIPARGGSQRIPRKNLRQFCGQPIIAYSIGAALDADIFSEVMVSTDDPEIADYATSLGASVPFLRSAENSDSRAGTFAVWKEVLDAYAERGKHPDTVASLMATAPFLSATLLREAWESFRSHDEWESLMAVVRYSPAIQRAMQFHDGVLKMVWPEHKFSRSQDLEPAFHDAGLFYFFDGSLTHRVDSLRDSQLGAFEVAPGSAHDIDTEADWILAESKYADFLSTR